MTNKHPNGCVAWEGNSLLDGAPIVLILTCLERPSANIKTGQMVQSIVIRQDMSPLDAVLQAKDSSVCGSCPLRRGSCYVGPTSAMLAQACMVSRLANPERVTLVPGVHLRARKRTRRERSENPRILALAESGECQELEQMPEYDENNPDIAIACEAKADEITGNAHAIAYLKEVEDRLLEESLQHMKQLPGYAAQAADMEMLFNRAKTDLMVRRKVIDLAAKTKY